MAENIQEIATLIENLKRENKNSNEDFINFLNEISNKLNNIQNDNGERNLAINNIQQMLNSKIQIDNEKINELDNTLADLKAAINNVTDYSELVQQVQVLTDNFKSGFNAVVNFANKDADAKNILLDRIQDLENAVKDGSMIEALRQRTDDLVKDYENFISDSNLRHGNMVSALVDLKNKIDDYSSKNNYILATIEHSMNDANSKILNLESTVSSNLGNVNSKLYSLGDDLQRILNDSFDHLKYLSSNMSEAMNSNSLDFKTTIEALKANVLSFSDNLKDEFANIKSNISNKIDDVQHSESLVHKEMLEKVKDIENTLLAKANDYENSISDKFANLNNFIDALNEAVVTAKIENNEHLSAKLQELSGELKEVSSNFSQLMANSAQEIRNISGSINQNSENIIQQLQNTNAEEIAKIKDELLASSGDNFAAIVEKIQGINDNVENFKNTTASSLTDYLTTLKEMFVDFSKDVNISVNNTEILDKLNNLEIIMSRFDIEKNDNFNHLQILIENNKAAIEDLKISTQANNNLTDIQTIIEEHSRNKDEKLDNIQVSVNNYQDTIEKLSANVQAQTENTLNELSELKAITNGILQKEPENPNIDGNLEKLSAEIQVNTANTLNELSELKAITNEILHKGPDNPNIDGNIERLAAEIQTNAANTLNELSELKAITNEILQKEPGNPATDETLEKLSAELQANAAKTLGELSELKAYTSSTLAKQSDIDKYTELLSDKMGDCKDTISEEAASIKSSINAIKDSLIELSPVIEINEIASKLSNIENQFTEAFENYDLSLSILNVRLNEYTESLANSKGFSTSDLTNYEAEFDEIKNQFEAMEDKMSNLIGNSGLIEILANIRQQFNVINTLIGEQKEETVANVKETLDEVVFVINNNLYLLGQNIEAIYERQSDISTNIIGSLDTNLEAIKTNIHNLIEGIEESVESKVLTVIKDFEPLKEAINKYTETDFNKVISEVKEAIELSYVNLKTEMSEKIDDSINFSALETKYQESVSQLSGLEDIIQSSIQAHIETINDTLLNIHGTTQNNSAVLEDLQSGFQTDLMLLEGKVQDFANSTREIIAVQLDEIKESIELSYSELKSEITAQFDKNINFDELEQKYQNSVSQLGELENIIQNSIQSNIDTINNNLVSIHNFTQNNSVILEDLQSGFQTDLMTLESKVQDFANSTKETITTQLDEIKEYLSSLNNYNPEDIKNAIVPFLDNEELVDTVRTINKSLADKITELKQNGDLATQEVLDIVNSIRNTVDYTVDLIKEKFETSDYKSDKIIQSLEEINDKFEVLVMASNDDTLKNIVTEINRQTDNTAQSITQVMETITRIDIKTTTDFEFLRGIAEDIVTHTQEINNYTKLLDEINSKLENSKIEGSENLSQSVEEACEKIDSFKKNINEILNFEVILREIILKLDIIAIDSEQDELSENINTIKDAVSEYQNNYTKSEENISNLLEFAKLINSKLDIVAQSDGEELLTDMAEVKDSLKSVADKVDILAQADNEEVLADIAEVKDNLKSVADKVDVLAQADNEEVLADIAEVKDNLKSVADKVDILAQADNEEVLDDIANLKEHFEKVEYKIDCLSELNFNELKPSVTAIKDDLKEIIEKTSNNHSSGIDELKGDLSNVKDDIQKLVNRIDVIAQTDNEDEVYDEISDLKELITTVGNKIDIIAQSSDNEDVILEELEQVQDDIKTLTRKFDLELKSNDNLFGADISDIKYNVKEIYSKLDDINSDTTKELTSKVDELHSNIDTISDAISNQNYVDNESFKNKLDELKNQLINTESTLDGKLEKISQFDGVNDKLDDIKSNISDGSIHLKDLVKELNAKVDIIAMSDDSVIIDEISEIKQVIEDQIDAIRTSSARESNQNSNELRNMMSELERIDKTIKAIDLTKSTAEIKNTVITALESITSGKETEKIKSFVDERTNEIQHVLMEVKRQLSAISNTGDDMDLYTYTMQDVESDLAKLRLVVNDMSNKVGDSEISVVSSNLNKMTRTMDDLQRTIVATGLDKATSANLGKEVLSISSRLNQLILAQQDVDKNEQIQNTLIIRNLQKTIKNIDEKLEYSTNIVTILKNVMMYLGEWMDGTTETLSSIYDKCDITEIVEDLQNTVKASVTLSNSSMEKLQEVISSRLENLETIYEKRIFKQEARLDRIEKQLDRICNLLDASMNDTVTNRRIDEIDERLMRLSSSIEKLTAYVE